MCTSRCHSVLLADGGWLLLTGVAMVVLCVCLMVSSGRDCTVWCLLSMASSSTSLSPCLCGTWPPIALVSSSSSSLPLLSSATCCRHCCMGASSSPSLSCCSTCSSCPLLLTFSQVQCVRGLCRASMHVSLLFHSTDSRVGCVFGVWVWRDSVLVLQPA